MNPRRLLTHWLMAQTLAILIALPATARVFKLNSRYCLQWQPLDGILVTTTLLALGLIVLLVGEGVLRWLGARVLRLGFVLAVGGSAISFTHFCLCQFYSTVNRADSIGTTLWLVFLGLLAACRGRCWDGLVAGCRTACLILSAIIPIHIIMLLGPPWFGTPIEPFPASFPPRDTAGTKNSVYVIILDEMSYTRAFTRGEGRLRRPDGRLPFLSTLSERSIIFHDAHSPSTETLQSIPMFLCQTKQSFRITSSGPYFTDPANTGPGRRPGEMPNLFSTARTNGYWTCAVGFLHPYRLLLGTGADYTRSFDFYRPIRTGWINNGSYYGEVLAARVFRPVSSYWGTTLKSILDRDAQITRLEHTHQEALRIIRDFGKPTFALLHYSLPHDPNIFDGDLIVPPGTLHGVDAYYGNMKRADSLLGELVRALMTKGLFDSSTIIVTSDHSWRFDPDASPTDDRGVTWTHVPLVIKPPFGSKIIDVDQRVDLHRIGHLIFDLSVASSEEESGRALETALKALDRLDAR